MTDTTTPALVWVADDDRSIRWVLKKSLERAGFEARVFASGDELLAALEAGEAAPAVVLSDIRMPGTSGVALLEALNERLPETPVLIMTAFSDLESAVSAFRGGAFEYLAKPFDVAKAVELVERAAAEHARRSAETPAPAPVSGSASGTPELVGRAKAMQDVFRAIGRLAQSSVTVLLTGESGSGKEVVARAIQRNSPRSRAPYVAINMAAIPKELLESELFGHEKGAFTGATATRIGRFEQASGGTIFLDEIGDMPMELQTRLLRVLSSGTFYRVGGREPIRADARVIAATNRNLEEAVARGTFREDLYHRLNVIRLRLPPLRERPEDVAPLARHFLTTLAAELGVEPKTLAPEAIAALERFRFPGNVRQLENICRWLLVMAPSSEVRLEDLPYEVQRPAAAEAPAGVSAFADWREALEAEARTRLAEGESHLWANLTEDVERALIRAALGRTGGRRIEAAELLGLGRNTLTRKIRALALDEEV